MLKKHWNRDNHVDCRKNQKAFLSFYLRTLNSSGVFVSDFSFYTRSYLWDTSHIFGLDVIVSDFFIQSRRLK